MFIDDKFLDNIYIHLAIIKIIRRKMINNKKQPISRRKLWGFVGIGCRKLATSYWGYCGSY